MIGTQVDLHIHSSCSDGTDSPDDLPRIAAENGLSAFALTDHDTVSGLARARAACRAFPGLAFVPGVELSAKASGRMHILGLFIEENDELCEFLFSLEQKRRERNEKIFHALRGLGIPISRSHLPDPERVSITRAHFARALVTLGVSRDMDAAFASYLQKGGPAYFPQPRPESFRCIEMIHRAGGLAVLAHPYTLKLPESETYEDALRALREQGLDGVECYYHGYAPETTERLKSICSRLGLCVSGGSDYHGKNKVNRMGQTGAGRVPADVFSDLRAFWQSRSR